MFRKCLFVGAVLPSAAVFLLIAALAAQVSAEDRLPSPELDLELQIPIRTWDEGLPLGGGLLGGLLWGEDSTLRLSLDRGDLWDERSADGMQWELFTYENLVKHVQAKDMATVNKVFDRAYRDKHPTKIPAGSLPPWKGDYHNDLNTQMTYMGYQGAGHFEEGACYLDFLWNRLPRFRRFAREFYGTDGAAAPGVMTLAGEPLAGWVQYSLSPTMSAWSAHLFYLHWRYTMDDTFLREHAYSWCREVGLCMKQLLHKNEKGVLVLSLSSSPEVFNNSQRAWLAPNTNYDLMCLRMLFLALAEMADAVGDSQEADNWKRLSEQLGPYFVRDDGTLKLCADTDLPGSHRHLSNLMGLHPFNLITADGSESDQRIIDATLDEWERFGTQAWTGYSFSWMSALRARVGRAEEAVTYLDLYAKAFILRNGFHANGDQTRSGFSGFTYRPLTLEGNFLAMNALHEMVLQSWSPAPGQRDTEVIRIFPAMPWRWHNGSFDDLRTEGGHRVSAERVNNGTVRFALTAGRDGAIRIRDNFGGRTPSWNGSDVHKKGTDFVVHLRGGETITATLPTPSAIPEPPADAAQPIVIPSR